MEAELTTMLQDRTQLVIFLMSMYPMKLQAENMTGLNQAHLVAGHQTSVMRTCFERGPGEGASKNSSGTFGGVRALCKAGKLNEALHNLNQQGIQADSRTYACLLQECIASKGLAEGKQVHAHIIKSGFKPNVFVLNTLVNMYSKCGSLVDACQLFDKMPERDMFTWTIMIAGYVKHGCGREALRVYEQMLGEGVIPSKVTYICILNACASVGALEMGKEVHANIIKAGIASYINLENALIDMYAKCGSMKNAHGVFSNIAERDVVSWNAMIAGYALHGCGREALELYEQMQQEGVRPDMITFICLLNACASIGALEKGREVHADIMKRGITSYVNLKNTLVDMYAKCGSIKDARKVFDNMTTHNVVSWNSMIAGYAHHGCGGEALELFEQMQQEGVTPDKVTFTCVLNACSSLGSLEKGKQVHAALRKSGIASHINLENTLVDMYAKCGSIKDARSVFDNMAERDLVSWSAMIAGYGHHRCGREALEIYEQMKWEEIMLDRVVFTCVLNACASLGALEKGKCVHADISVSRIVPDIILHNTLIDMYTKCGSVKDARQVFDFMVERDVVSGNTMIAEHGCGREVVQLFEQMQLGNLRPDGITFVSLLSACNHVGLVDLGCHYYDSMCDDHGLIPTVEHFGCMVDLLGRAGQLDEAEYFINKMPVKPAATVLGTLLGACKVHGDVGVAKRVAKSILKSDP